MLIRLFGAKAVVACLAISVCAFSAQGGELPVNQNKLAVTPVHPMTVIAVHGPAPVSKPTAPVLIAIKLRFDETTAGNQAAQAVPAVPTEPTKSLSQPDEPLFLPVLRQTDNPADTQNRGNFIERHEFGISFRSRF